MEAKMARSPHPEDRGRDGPDRESLRIPPDLSLPSSRLRTNLSHESNDHPRLTSTSLLKHLEDACPGGLSSGKLPTPRACPSSAAGGEGIATHGRDRTKQP